MIRPVRRLLLAITAVLTPVASTAQTQSPQQERTRESFSRFFEMHQKAARPSGVALGVRRSLAAEEVKKTPGAASSRQRLLKAQEERTTQPDPVAFAANNPVLEEVAASDDPDFAQVIFWNEAALRITALDHTPLTPGSAVDTHPFEQVGPARTSRAMAIVHVAMFEAVNAVQRRFQSYKGIQGKIFAATSFPPDIPATDVSIRHAIAFGAYRALLGLYPNKAADLSFTLAANLNAIQESSGRAVAGMAIGDAAAMAILEERKFDGAELPDCDVTCFLSMDPLKWQRDPLNLDIATALGSNWRYVKPFVLKEAAQFRPVPPPPVTDPIYIKAFNEVVAFGGDPDAGKTTPPGNLDRRPTPTSRTPDQTFIGKFWAYDGTALLCAPPRLYNMIATSLALNEEKGTIKDALEMARFLAMINVVMADAGIAAWEAKYHYIYPRPVTAIRAAKPEDSPIAAPSPFWSPLGAPVSNARPGKVNFTPPFPAYPSGHAVFGGALFETFRLFWNDPKGPKFTFVSDEYNGHNSDPGSPTPRPLMPMTFDSFAVAEAQNAKSRIYLGIHWQFDADAGVAQGNQVARYVYPNVFAKLSP